VLFDFQGDEELAMAYEQEMIAKWKPEYNISFGGEGGRISEATRKKIGDAHRGMTRSEETRRRIGEANRRRVQSAETRKKIGDASRGRVHSEENIRKMSEANKGRVSPNKGKTASAETVRKMSLAHMGRAPTNKGIPHSEETRKKMSAAHTDVPRVMTAKLLAALSDNIRKAQDSAKIPVKCLADGRVFASAAEADRFYGFSVGTVRTVTSGRNKSTHGMVFIRYDGSENK